MIKFDNLYYKKLIKIFKYSHVRVSELNFNIGRLKIDEIKLRWVCHTDADKFVEKLNNKEISIVTTGFGLSGSPHIGTLSQRFLQNKR